MTRLPWRVWVLYGPRNESQQRCYEGEFGLIAGGQSICRSVAVHATLLRADDWPAMDR
jgi:hypothetical protein